MQKQVIRFDDTTVALAYKSDEELKKSYFVFATMQRPFMANLGRKLTKWALKMNLPVRRLIKNTLFNQFCGGESIADSAKKVNHLAKFNVKTILDYSVEGESDEMSFDRTCKEIVEVCKAAKDNPNVPFCVVKLTGLGSSTLMEKIQSEGRLLSMGKSKLNYMQERAEKIAQTTQSSGLLFMIDAEESWVQVIIDEVARELMAKYNRDYPLVYNTYQLYCKDALGKLKRDASRALQGGYHLGAKIVRGAYMEKERERAEQMKYDDPIQVDKSSTDTDYDEALKFCLENIENMGICAGTHNEKSSAYLADLMEKHKIQKDDPRVFFAQLLGMSDHISFNLAEAGYNVAKYVPYGPVEKVMPYLFRRTEENTSIAGQSRGELALIKKEIHRRKQLKRK